MSEFLEQLELEAAERLARIAELRIYVPCSICKGTGSVTRYVLPHVLGPVECSSCKGTGAAP